MAVIRTWLVVVGALLVLSGCQLGLIEQDAPGNPEDAAAAAPDFLALLADGKADEAWAHMRPATRAAAYGGDREAFVADVSAADWSATQWEIRSRGRDWTPSRARDAMAATASVRC